MSSTRVLSSSDDRWLPEALQVIREGGLVAFPTDTVYGLGCDAFNRHAVERIYECKGRGTEKAIPILIATSKQLSQVTRDLGVEVIQLGASFWPGPLTLVLEKHPDLPQEISEGRTVGIRIPAHPIAQALLEAWGPMAVTSANRSGDTNTLVAEEVLAQLDGRFDLLIDGGATPGGEPSTVVDCTIRPIGLLRKGPIQMEEVLESLKSLE